MAHIQSSQHHVTQSYGKIDLLGSFRFARSARKCFSNTPKSLIFTTDTVVEVCCIAALCRALILLWLCNVTATVNTCCDLVDSSNFDDHSIKSPEQRTHFGLLPTGNDSIYIQCVREITDIRE